MPRNFSVVSSTVSTVTVGWNQVNPNKDFLATYIELKNLDFNDSQKILLANDSLDNVHKQFTLDHLKPGATYQMRVFSENSFGISNFSRTLTSSNEIKGN